MTKVSPFHSNKPGILVYHNNDKCTEGNNIEPENRVDGTGGKTLCKRCEELNKEEK